eukprot:TRINITY_DN2603_c0_g1_i1.p1 TRINITY_DN2603_c0_g1~~TRINITY_DN2603_c0_g1_i1.p1  ORF type:complete len:429 (+),score=85.63 TRINITY_DN2603_c0_g1_i1:124-1410(+)
MVFGLKLGLPKASKAAPAVEEPAKAKEKDAAGSSKGGHEGGRSSGRGALTVNEFVARTKRCREKGLEPTKPELIAYARYLGIDPIIDGDLMWIADEALAAPLPSEWTEHHDSADRVFYYNVQTHASSWTHPLEQLHRDTYKQIVNFRSGDLSKEEQSSELDKQRRKADDSEREAHKELQSWSEHTDEGGQKFFYNREKQVSVWTDPRPARCHSLYLQKRALRELSKHCGGSGADLLGVSGEDPRREKMRIQQSLVIGSPDLGRSNAAGRDKSLDDESPARGGRSQQPAEESGGEGREDDRRERRKEKKRGKKDKHRGEGRNGEELLDLTEDDAGGHPEGGHVDLFKKPVLDLKKPSLSAVEEVRAALGVAPPGVSGGGGGGLGGSTLPSISGHHGLGRLPTPPGDGLSSVGRAKVRAGIRLEPLRGGA